MRKLLILICGLLLLTSCVSTKSGYNLSKIQNEIQNYEIVSEDLRSSGVYNYHDFGDYKIKGCDVGTIYIQKYYNLNLAEKQKYPLTPDKSLILSDRYYTKIERDSLSYYDKGIRNIRFRFQELDSGSLILRLYIDMKINSNKKNHKEAKILSANSNLSILADELYSSDSYFIITESNISEIEKIFSDNNAYFEIDNMRTKFSEDECYYIKTYLNIFPEYSKLKKEFLNMLVKKFGQKDADAMIKGNLRIGMSIDALEYMMGYPDHTNTTSGSWGVHKQLVYKRAYLGDQYIYVENGIVTSWQY